MKREELTALGIEQETADKIMALHGRDIEKHKANTADAAKRADELSAQIEDIKYKTAADAMLGKVNFSSKSAKTAFVEALKAAQLPLENGAITGFDEFLSSYKADDAAAFTPDNAEKQPVIMLPTGNTEPEKEQSAALRAAFGLK